MDEKKLAEYLQIVKGEKPLGVKIGFSHLDIIYLSLALIVVGIILIKLAKYIK